jgi:hypothetical protein
MLTESQVRRCVRTLGYTGRSDVHRQAQVLLRALVLYAERNERYHDNWRRSGWRGVVVRIRERSDRLWDAMWPGGIPYGPGPIDDAIDMINFAAFLVRAIDGETTRDGEWWT